MIKISLVHSVVCGTSLLIFIHNIVPNKVMMLTIYGERGWQRQFLQLNVGVYISINLQC